MKLGTVLKLLLTGGILLSSAAAENGTRTSLDQVGIALDGTENALEQLRDASQAGDLQGAKAALLFYIRSLSEFHTKLARLRIERQNGGFMKSVARSLNSEIGATRMLTENAQPAIRPALNEAMNHLSGALDLAEQAVNPRRRLSFRISIRGPESSNPGARSWPPQGPLGIAEPQSRLR